MPDPIEDVVESIVGAARIPNRRRRLALRRELRSHFADSGTTPEAIQAALVRFGDVARIGGSFRAVYRADYRRWYAAKVAGCAVVATIAAIVIEAVVNLRFEPRFDGWPLSSGFVHAAAFGVMLTLALIAGGEASRAPFSASRAFAAIGGYLTAFVLGWGLDASGLAALITATLLGASGVGLARMSLTWTAKALLTLVVFAFAEYLFHRWLGVALAPLRTAAAGATLVMLWTSTIAIVTWSDRAFLRTFTTD